MSRSSLRIALMGHQEWGVRCLTDLLAERHNVVGVVTPPPGFDDDPGSYHTVWYSSLREAAVSRGIRVLSPADVNSPEVVDTMRRWAPDIIVTIAYGQILKAEVLRIPSVGAVNLHCSLLPRHRGRTPLCYALIEGDHEAGVSAHFMTPEIDEGPVIAQGSFRVTSGDTAWSLISRTIRLCPELLMSILDAIRLRGSVDCTPQDPGLATHHRKRSRADEIVDWNSSTVAIDQLVRGLAWPYRGAVTAYQGRQVVIWSGTPGPRQFARGLPGDIVDLGPRGEPFVRTSDGVFLITAWGPEPHRAGRGHAAPTFKKGERLGCETGESCVLPILENDNLRLTRDRLAAKAL